MKKIPTLFKRVFTEDHQKTITREVTPGCECVLRGECTATVKWDGACCAIINGEIWKRYDAKHGKKPPEGAIPCQPEPDPITTHWPHWVKCDPANPADKYFLEAYRHFQQFPLLSINNAQPYNLGAFDGTYEAVGPAWQSNPYGLARNTLHRHGDDFIGDLWLRDDGKPDTFAYNKIRGYLETHEIEGIVFWLDGQPLCKIKRSDFGFEWPVKSNKSKEA
jgi:hypothetical protein